jgi:hypothetical protein
MNYQKYFKDRIFIEDSKHDLYVALKEATGLTMKDIFLLSVAISYNEGKKQEVKNKRDIFSIQQFSEQDFPLLLSIAMDDIRRNESSKELTFDKVFEKINKESVSSIIESYANAGIDRLVEISKFDINQKKDRFVSNFLTYIHKFS